MPCRVRRVSLARGGGTQKKGSMWEAGGTPALRGVWSARGYAERTPARGRSAGGTSPPSRAVPRAHAFVRCNCAPCRVLAARCRVCTCLALVVVFPPRAYACIHQPCDAHAVCVCVCTPSGSSTICTPPPPPSFCKLKFLYARIRVRVCTPRHPRLSYVHVAAASPTARVRPDPHAARRTFFVTRTPCGDHFRACHPTALPCPIAPAFFVRHSISASESDHRVCAHCGGLWCTPAVTACD